MSNAPDESPSAGDAAASTPIDSVALEPHDASVPAAAFQQHVRAARTDFEHHVAQARADFDLANEKIKERTGRNLILATLIGLAVGGVALASLLFIKWLFLLFAVPVALLGIFEFTRALQASGKRVDVVPQLIAGAALMLSGFFVDPWLHWVTAFAAVAFVIVWRLVAQMTAHDGRTYEQVLSDVLLSVFVQLYVPFLASLTLVLLGQEGGEWWLVAMLGVAVSVDTGAYGAGLSFGRHPMAPRISPKKTWEGFAGAAVASAIAGVLFGLFMLHLPWWAGLIFGLVILGTATIGDLGESMIKRDLGIKDMSSWLPGHGGVLDRLDSILPSAVAALALYTLMIPLVVV